uniref:Neural cell adhesion molecule L1.1-like n=1 Tax=Mastacembelus armatus TaxID=205130 RepID=A0A7N8Y9I8_9TELE
NVTPQPSKKIAIHTIEYLMVTIVQQDLCSRVFHYYLCVCVEVSQPPVLIEMPTSYTAFSQEDFNLPCEATGNPIPTFRWVKDGETFGAELKGSGTLRADEEEPLNSYEGSYRCYASNTLGTAMTQTVKVIVESQPVLLKQQKIYKTAYEGNSMILSCNPPESSTLPHIHWMDKKMVHIKQSDRVMVGLDGKLYFSNLIKSDSRDDYICNAQYAAARTILPETAVNLTVMPSNDVHGKKPHLLHPSGSHTPVLSLKGHSVTLECIPKGLPTPKVEWKKMDGSLHETSGELDNYDRWLHFDSISENDDGEYECKAFNSHGFTTHSFTVTVEAAPYWVKEPQSLLYAPGETVRLDCQAEGIPTPTITWSINEVDDDPRRSVSGGVLWLKDVEFADTAVYQCEASNKHGSILLNTYLHVVELSPQILSSDGMVYRVIEGGEIKLHCESFGSPRPHVTWEGEDTVPLLSDPRISLLTSGTLELSHVSHDDSGAYTCSIKHTNISITAHLEVFNRTVILTSPQHVRALRGTSALLDCHFYKDPQLFNYPIVWRRDGHKLQDLSLSWIPGHSHNSPIIGTEHEWKRVPGDFNHQQLSLHPYCTYRFRVIAVNEIGRSDPSIPSGYHSTPPAVPDSNPSGVRSDSTDPKTLKITWDEMDRRSHNGKRFQYKVSWREAGSKNAHWNHGYIESPPFLVNNTGTYTPFEIKVQAVNSLGEGPAPDPEIGHSGEDNPQEAPTGVESTVMNRTVRVKWKEAQNVRGLLLGYKEEKEERLDRGKSKEQAKDSRVVVVHGNRTSEEVTGLKLYSRYELFITAFNSKGEGPHSTPHRFNTSEGVPGPPASLTFDSPSENSLILYWTPPVETNGILLGYMVQYQQEVESRDSLLQMQMISDPSVTHIVLDQLDPNSYYNFKVIARTAAGDGPPITQRGATLFDGVPPSNITIVPSNTSLNLTWAPGERHRNHGFRIRYLRKSAGGRWEESEIVNSTQGFYSLTGLQQGTQYHLMIMHGNYTEWEDVTRTRGPEMPAGFATQGWLIGLISAIVLLVLILLILCLIKRSKGGKYAVKDKEDKEVDSEARPMKDEAFGEYRSLESDGDEKRSDSQPSLCGDSKLGSEDSLAEYGDSVDIQFNEDGSFIGQYSGRGPVPHGNESSGPASPVNAVPPPPVAPSMSSILNRPS